MIPDKNCLQILDELIVKENNHIEDNLLASPMALALMGRKGLKIYRMGDERNSSAVIEMMHPHNDDVKMLLPVIGKPDYDLFLNVVYETANDANEVHLSRFSEDDIEQTKKMFDLNLFNDETMDWVYPIHVYSTQDVSEMSGGRFKKLRTKCNVLNDNFDITVDNISTKEELLNLKALHKNWEGQLTLDGRVVMDVDTYYVTLFDLIENYPERFEGLLFFVNGVAQGFTIWEKRLLPDVQDTVMFLASLTNYKIKDLSMYQVAETCRVLSEQGILYCDMGGSETEGVDTFKRRYFNPIKSTQLYSAKLAETESIVKEDIISS